jgi:molybdopterin molybdotransferase
MDGYAVRSTDVAGASPERPVRLRVLETVAAGMLPARVVETGTATRIMTGAAMPEGADAVVPVENTAVEDDVVEVRVLVRPGEAVRGAGEDLRAGAAVFQPGRLLRPADIGVLASLGTTMLRVVRRPRVAILATGDELVDIGQPQGPGQIVNSNEYALAAAVEEAGGEPIRLGIVRDRREDLSRAFQEAFTADLVLSTGGVSMGTFDYVRALLRDLGYQERFWKVAQKPGKPLTFGLRDGTPAFGLPGNPVSALVCFYIYVLPAMRTMAGMTEVHLPRTAATLAEPLIKKAGLTEFVRCILEGPPHDRRARSTGTQSSGVLSSVSTGHGLIVTPQDAAVVEKGTRVRVVLLKPDAGSPEAPF